MTVMMFALYLKWRVCGNRSGGQQGKEQEERHRGVQQWGGGGTEDMSQESPAKGGIVGEALNGPCCLS